MHNKGITSDLNVNVWMKELSNSEEDEFLLNGIKEGFAITNVKKDIKTVRVDNYKSTADNREAVEKQITTELEEGRYVIVQSPPKIISALGAIPKDDGAVRLIHDCSQPEGSGVNDYAVLDYDIKYQTVQDACELLERNWYMAKVDLKSAYRSVPLHPSQYQFTGLQWTFTGDENPTYMIDTRLPFGARLSPSHFHRLSQAVKRMLEKRQIKVVVYLDDIYITAPTFLECKHQLNTVITLLRELGFSIAWQKIAGPSQTITFLGIEIDSKRMQIRLPYEKVVAYKILLQEFLDRPRASLRQLQRLAGILAFTSNVVSSGRPYQQRILDLLRSVRRPHHKVRLGADVKDDIQWWITILEHTNSSPIRKRSTPVVTVFTDASQTGAGIVSEQDWAYIAWDQDLPHMTSKHVNIKETVAVIAAAYRWAPEWRGKAVVVYTDNMTARAAINKGRCSDEETMHHIRNLYWIAHFYNFSIRCEHIKGSCNVEADSVSRLNQKGHLMFWLSKLSGGAPYTLFHVYWWFIHHMSIISCASLLSQVHQRIPWLQNWTRQLRNTEEWHLRIAQNKLIGLT